MFLQSSGSEPFRYWIFDNWYIPLNRQQLDSTIVSHPWEVGYDNDVERGKRTSRNFGQMIPELQTAFIKLRHPDTVKEFARLANVPTLIDDPVIHGGGLHLSVNGSYLQTHLDYELHPTLPNRERRLNLILFMHDRWESDWGGELLLCDAACVGVVRIEPLPGRLAVFECGPGSFHGVRVVMNPQAVRLSCAVYYLADARASAIRRRAMFAPNRNREKGGVPAEVA